jgi:hypothetical protein
MIFLWNFAKLIISVYSPAAGYLPQALATMPQLNDVTFTYPSQNEEQIWYVQKS